MGCKHDYSSLHSFRKEISALDIPRRDYERDCADANFFRAFLREMKQKSIEVAIASFGKRDVIETYIKHLVDAEKGDDVADYAFVDTKEHSDPERCRRYGRVFDERQESDVRYVDKTVRAVDE